MKIKNKRTRRTKAQMLEARKGEKEKKSSSVQDKAKRKRRTKAEMIEFRKQNGCKNEQQQNNAIEENDIVPVVVLQPKHENNVPKKRRTKHKQDEVNDTRSSSSTTGTVQYIDMRKIRHVPNSFEIGPYADKTIDQIPLDYLEKFKSWYETSIVNNRNVKVLFRDRYDVVIKELNRRKQYENC